MDKVSRPTQNVFMRIMPTNQDLTPFEVYGRPFRLPLWEEETASEKPQTDHTSRVDCQTV